jgi:hypothetical protein
MDDMGISAAHISEKVIWRIKQEVHMRVVYVREIIKEKTNSAKVCFSTAAKSINDNASAGKRQTSALIKRVLGKHGPKP